MNKMLSLPWNMWGINFLLEKNVEGDADELRFVLASWSTLLSNNRTVVYSIYTTFTNNSYT